MAKRPRGLDFGGTTTETEEYKTVFIDTNLDTHLAMLVSKSDTVSDFKNKMVLEHMKCFPKLEEIHIHSLKVKRKAKFYHLPDSMHVWSAFHGVKGNRFLSVDASSTPSCHLNQKSSELGINDCMKMGVMNVDNNFGGLLSDINRIQTLPLSLPDGVTTKNAVSEIIPGFKVENSLEKTTDIWNSKFPKKICIKTKRRAKKKRKMRLTEDICHNPNFDATTEVLGVRNDQSVLDEGTAVPAVAEKSNVGSTLNCENHLGSDGRKEETLLENISPDMIASKKEYELGQDVWARETAANIQDTTEVGRTLKCGSIQPYTETHKSEEQYFSLNCDHEDEIPSSDKCSDHDNPYLTQKEASEITVRSKKMRKTKRAKKLDNTNLEKSGIEQNNGFGGRSGLVCPTYGHIPEEADKEESILFHKGEDAQLKLLNASTEDVNEKVLRAHENEADFVMSTQTKQALEAIADGKRVMDKETQNSAGIAHADFPVLEKENQILESNLVEKDNENIVHKDKKAKNKRRKKILATSDVQENSTVKDKFFGVGVSTAEEYSMTFVNPETEGIHVASSQVLSRKSEEKLEEKHEIAVNTDDLARTTEDEGEGINSTQYFVPGQYQDKVGSPGKLKIQKANQSNMEMKILKKEKINGLPSDTEESILYHKGEDVQLELQYGSTQDADEKVLGAHENEADFVMSTQTKQTLVAVANGKREMDYSAGIPHADFLVLEKENQILDSKTVEKDNENTVNKDKKAKKKRSKKTLATSDVQENLTFKDQKVGVGVSTAEENSICSVNFETVGIHVASSHVLSPKSEEKLEEKHEIAVNTDDLARTTEDEGEGINFKQYFVPGQYQDKVGSPGKLKLKKSSQSNIEMKILKKGKQYCLPSVSISTEVESSLKVSATQESENKTCAGKVSAKRQGDSAQNSDRDEVLPSSSRRSSRVWENVVKDFSTNEMSEINIKKLKEIHAESSIQTKGTPLSSNQAGKVQRKFLERENKRSQSGLSGTNRMEFKTPEKKSLLTKAGAIFEDNTGESSGDENWTAHSSGSTRSSSDSSSMSDHLMGERNLSQDSTRNGSSDAKERSTGRKGTSKLEHSAPENMTMHMILRSSKRFKKAKLIASQNEIEPIEFVPDSMPI